MFLHLYPKYNVHRIFTMKKHFLLFTALIPNYNENNNEEDWKYTSNLFGERNA